MGEKREGFVFYRSFYEALSALDPESRDAVFMAICEYGLDGEEPEGSGVVSAIFSLIKPQIDANNQRYANGKKGGRPKTESEPNNNQTETEVKPNQNQSETNQKPNDNQTKPNTQNSKPKEKEKEKEKYKEKESDAVAIVEFLNSTTHKSYRANSKQTVAHINARLREGYTIDDFKTVISKKAREWLGTDMEQYLRPETLFSPSKFESYLNAPLPLEQQEREKKERAKSERDAQDREQLLQVEQELKTIVLPDNLDRWRELKTREDFLKQRLGVS